MSKIISNFYLIRLGGEPVYVGYTNRPIKTRFSEHKRDKDFGDVETTVESLGSLEYEFTWDIGLINSYAKEVSDRETALILEHNTQDSIWQKGTSRNLGGQTWNNIKNFIKTNRDNPAFIELDERDIMVLLEWQRKSYVKIQGMINTTGVKGAQKLRDMIKGTNIKGAQKLKSMVNHTEVKGTQKLQDMVKYTNIRGAQKLRNMIKHTNIRSAQKLNSMVNDTKVKGAQKLKYMVNNTKAKH